MSTETQNARLGDRRGAYGGGLDYSPGKWDWTDVEAPLLYRPEILAAMTSTINDDVLREPNAALAPQWSVALGGTVQGGGETDLRVGAGAGGEGSGGGGRLARALCDGAGGSEDGLLHVAPEAARRRARDAAAAVFPGTVFTGTVSAGGASGNASAAVEGGGSEPVT